MAVERRPRRPRPVRPPEERVERLRQLAALHDSWVRRYIDETPFEPDDYPERSDYNLHYVDMSASVEAQDEFFEQSRRIMGLDPETGRRRPSGPGGD